MNEYKHDVVHLIILGTKQIIYRYRCANSKPDVNRVIDECEFIKTLELRDAGIIAKKIVLTNDGMNALRLVTMKIHCVCLEKVKIKSRNVLFTISALMYFAKCKPTICA